MSPIIKFVILTQFKIYNAYCRHKNQKQIVILILFLKYPIKCYTHPCKALGCLCAICILPHSRSRELVCESWNPAAARDFSAKPSCISSLPSFGHFLVHLQWLYSLECWRQWLDAQSSGKIGNYKKRKKSNGFICLYGQGVLWIILIDYYMKLQEKVQWGKCK